MRKSVLKCGMDRGKVIRLNFHAIVSFLFRAPSTKEKQNGADFARVVVVVSSRVACLII